MMPGATGPTLRRSSAARNRAGPSSIDGVSTDRARPRLSVEDELDPLAARYLDDRLYELTAARTGVDDGRMLPIWLRDDAGEIVAGLYGWTWAGYCEVRAL